MCVLIGLTLWLGYHKLILPLKAKFTVHAAYSIHQCLQAHAIDHDDQLPMSTSNSNDAFREFVIYGLIDDERLFYLPGCAWHEGKKSDGNIGTKDNGFAEAVSKNENHWAYTSGLDFKTSPSNTPVVMSGFTETPGIWSGDKSRKGGFWMGKYAIIVFLSGNAKIIELDENYRAFEIIDNKRRDIMEMIKDVPGAELLNPDG